MRADVHHNSESPAVRGHADKFATAFRRYSSDYYVARVIRTEKSRHVGRRGSVVLRRRPAAAMLFAMMAFDLYVDHGGVQPARQPIREPPAAPLASCRARAASFSLPREVPSPGIRYGASAKQPPTMVP